MNISLLRFGHDRVFSSAVFAGFVFYIPFLSVCTWLSSSFVT